MLFLSILLKMPFHEIDLAKVPVVWMGFLNCRYQSAL
jgi:hypothetical protein